jgi:hypothetical protein
LFLIFIEILVNSNPNIQRKIQPSTATDGQILAKTLGFVLLATPDGATPGSPAPWLDFS